MPIAASKPALPSESTDRRTISRFAIAVLALFGAGLLFGIGFAGSDVLHNAAHDTRHASGFPCH